ncbi:AMIN domain-containing protein [Allocoleopsis sp.]|uniref:AMIN domain-containing protein n=1 Tax=Allocoleopsis sp. TaxID=3088169 RepID=UPI002FD4168F
MRQAQALSGIVIGGAVALLATQPSLATTTQVTDVRLDNSEGELKLTLETTEGAERPQVFTVSRGNDLVADIVNTQLSLNKGDSFQQKHPMPGIASVVVSQSDANSIRVTVSGTISPPTSQVIQSTQQGITLGISPEAKNQTTISDPASSSPDAAVSPEAADIPSLPSSKPVAIAATTSTPVVEAPNPVEQTLAQTPPTSVTQAPKPVEQVLAQAAPTAVTQTAKPVEQAPTPTLPTAVAQTANPAEQAPTPALPTSIAQTTVPQPVVPVQAPVAPAPAPQAPVPAPAPDVLVPNPQITIDGFPIQPAGPAGAVQPVAPAPPLLPRAIAPPVGDIAISNISAAASVIDLGTGVRVPRLVLREAPVREVLALLARSAGLNLAFTDGGGGTPQPGAPGAAAGGAQQTISLDLENEPVQDVFNYVLQLSGLQANRVGRTIFVGSRLPDGARNLVARTLRLNQVPVGQAVGFLISQGAEQQQITTQTTLTVAGEGAAATRIQNTQTQVQRITPQEAAGGAPGGAGGGAGLNGPLVLRGLAVSPDERLGAITLIGEPRKVEIATALLTQLDLRRRQVAVNVKIVDVNLSGTDVFNASFSFGIGDSFFVNDGGAASFNYGGVRPATQAQVTSSTITPPVINNPFANANVFLDPNRTVPVQGTAPGVTLVDSRTGQVTIGGQGTAFFNTPFVTINDPLQPGFTNITPATNTTITINADGTTTASAGTLGTVTTALPSLFQFPKRLLSALQAQITSGNAKILTDPTLVVQEGQTAVVNLTQEVFGGFRLQTQTDPTTNLTTQVQEPIIKNAGLILPINVQKIDDNGFITLVINPTVSAIGGSQNTPQGQITLVQQRQLFSGQIRLRDSQTLILSGIIQESDRTTVSKVPILGDIPILGALFRSTNRVNQRQEVIVLLTPQIIDDSQGSSFGYSYTPGRETSQFLRQRGVSP